MDTVHRSDQNPGTSDCDSRNTRCRRVVYLAPDCTDSAVKKRAHGFVSTGHDLISFSFRRARYNVEYVPDWPNIELGRTTERRLVSRLLVVLRALGIIHRQGQRWRDASMLYARNLDLALLALLGRIITRCRTPLIYEVLDVHPLLTKPGIRAAMLRWLERRVLNRCQLLVVSSPAFLRCYFVPRQNYRGDAFLLENKWPLETVSPQHRKLSFDLADENPVWTIGWFGNLRCQKSLKVLTELADALPGRVKIYMRGCASLLGNQTLMATIEGRSNMVYEGEYSAPEDLPSIYSKVHFNWCADFSGAENSDWLLPNRLYEGGYFGIPAIAAAQHETGRYVREHQLGIPLDPPYVGQLTELLVRMTPGDYCQMRSRIEDRPLSDFVDTGDLERMTNVAAKNERSRGT